MEIEEEHDNTSSIIDLLLKHYADSVFEYGVPNYHQTLQLSKKSKNVFSLYLTNHAVNNLQNVIMKCSSNLQDSLSFLNSNPKYSFIILGNYDGNDLFLYEALKKSEIILCSNYDESLLPPPEFICIDIKQFSQSIITSDPTIANSILNTFDNSFIR